MPTIYDLKPRFQALLRPYAEQLVGLGVTANQVTLAAFVMSALVGGLIALLPWATLLLLLVPIALFARMSLNAIDGMMAREHGQASRLGALLNELGDMASDAALYLPFALVPGLSPVLVVLAVVAALMTEGAGLAALQVGAGRRHDGPLGKSDRAVAFSLLAVLLGLGLGTDRLFSILLLVIIALAVWTIVNRVRAALAHQADKPTAS